MKFKEFAVIISSLILMNCQFDNENDDRAKNLRQLVNHLANNEIELGSGYYLLIPFENNRQSCSDTALKWSIRLAKDRRFTFVFSTGSNKKIEFALSGQTVNENNYYLDPSFKASELNLIGTYPTLYVVNKGILEETMILDSNNINRILGKISIEDV